MRNPVLLRVAALVLLALLPTLAPAARADDAETPAKAVSLPVKEVTVFKDGHALLLRAGTLPVEKDGNVVLQRLPAPVLGTFWPFADEAGAKLTSARAGQTTVQVAHTATEIVDLLRLNVGAQVIPTDVDGHSFHAKVLSVRGNTILLQDDEGVRVMPVARIREVVFREEPKSSLPGEVTQDRLTLGLSWSGPRKDAATVGYLALESGLRWIPSYKVDLLDGGKAHVRLQATIVDDLTDLDDVDVDLVIGVPTFAFSDTLDPIALGAAVAQVAQRMPRGSYAGQMLSNAIQTQVERRRDEGAAEAPTPPEVLGSAQNEDLYVFHVAHVTVGKGERLVVPVSDVTLSYSDVYTLDAPFSPPPEVWPQIAQQVYRNQEQLELLRLEAAPKVVHQARIQNDGPHPLTTAPALLFRNGKVLAQGLMTYTSAGGSVDLPITTAVDVHVKKSDREAERKVDAVRWQGDTYARVDMEGKLTLTSYKKEAVHLEVTRSLLGRATKATPDATIEGVNAMEEASWARWHPPTWWGWYAWPYWWYHFNSVSQVRWELDLEPGTSIDLQYAWSYYWR